MRQNRDSDFSQQWTLYYDAECALCTRLASAIDLVNTNDALTLCPLQKAAGEIRDQLDLEADAHLVGSSGAVLAGGAAVQQVLLLLPAARPLRWLLDGVFGRAGSAAVYASL
jgi:predicted DCC family thiol-disulfide oxidoreductase YuxK